MQDLGQDDVESLQIWTRFRMGPKPQETCDDQALFRTRLVNLIDQRHGMVKVEALIDWHASAGNWDPQSSRRRAVLRSRCD